MFSHFVHRTTLLDDKSKPQFAGKSQLLSKIREMHMTSTHLIHFMHFTYFTYTQNGRPLAGKVNPSNEKIICAADIDNNSEED